MTANPAGNVVSEAWRVGGNAGNGKSPPDYVKCGFQFFGGWKMGNQGGLARFVVRIICRVHSGREYWRGRVLPSMGGGKVCGESGEAGRKSGHGGDSPRAARFAMALNHEGARMRAHEFGMYGPAFFVLRAGE